MKQQVIMKWYAVWWIFKLFGFFVVIPWLPYHFFNVLWRKRRQAMLDSKVVMITGASSGLGEALAHVFYKCGCRIILVSRRKSELERVKNELINKYHTGLTHLPVVLSLDLCDTALLQTEITRVLEIHGKIDILINNAGISYRGEAINTNIDVDIKIMTINYYAQIALSKAVIPSMIKQRSGHLVYISSVQGKIAIPYRSAYAASKHALQAWCDTVRAELSQHSVKVTTISPGYINTSLSLNALTGQGEVYGAMDQTTLNGYSSQYVATRILNAVLKEEKDVVIAPLTPKFAIILRTIYPSLYFWIMERRAKKMMKEN